MLVVIHSKYQLNQRKGSKIDKRIMVYGALVEYCSQIIKIMEFSQSRVLHKSEGYTKIAVLNLW